MKALNPWLDLLGESPFCLQCDWDALSRHNKNLDPHSPYLYELHKVLPEPFIGRVDKSPVVILQLNPGYDENIDPQSHLDPSFRNTLMSNLSHSIAKYPFYYLDPSYKEHPGSIWWQSKTKRLQKLIGAELLSQNLAVVEWFPYKSTKFKDGCLVPSQEYGFSLVKRAIQRGALIIVSRSHRRWIKSVPELYYYKNVLTLSSSQNITLSENNLLIRGAKDPSAWELLVSRFRNE